MQRGVVAPEIISPRQPLGYSTDNPNGARPIVGKKFEFQLQASGTNTVENPLKFFVYKENTQEKAMPNGKGEYDLGNNLFLTEKGLIYSDCVLEYEGQGNGSIRQKNFYIGASNKNAYGDEQDSGWGYGYCFLKIVKGYMIDRFTISPPKTDIPRGGQRQFTANIEGIGDFDKTVTWTLYGYPTDENTKIDRNSGLLTIGANETSTDLKVIGYLNGGKQSIPTDPINIIDHIHSTHFVEAVTSTCQKDGNIEHFRCDSCGGMFSDSKAINTLREEEVIIKAKHEYTEMIGLQNATCIAKGMQAHFRCKNCDKLFELGSLNEVTAESLELPIDPNGHYTDIVNGIDATCANDGIYPHENCKYCHKNLYSDGITEMVNVIEPKNDNHILEKTWTATAEGHYHKCSRDGCKDNGCVEFAKHIPNRSEATNDEPIKCEICNYIIAPAISHTHHLSLVPGKASTCFENGKRSYYTCDGCSILFEDEAGTKTIDTDLDSYLTIPKAHKFGKWIDEVKATNKNTGTMAHKDCTYCGKHFDKDNNEIKDLTIAKLTDSKNNGINGGAIASIIVASTIVIGIGTFSIFYFVIKKKTFKELIEVIFKRK